MSHELIVLSRCAIVRGYPEENENRIAKIVGDQVHNLGPEGLKLNRFPGKNSWPEKDSKFGIGVVQLEDGVFEDFSAVQAQLVEELRGEVWELGGFPELMSDYIRLSLRHLWTKGIENLIAPNSEAFWKDSGNLCHAPFRFSNPHTNYLLSTYWIDYRWDEEDLSACAFLVSYKIDEKKFNSTQVEEP